MWGLIGSLDEWRRFLGANDRQEAAYMLLVHSRALDEVYDDLSRIIRSLYESPTGEVTDTVLIARTAIAEAAGMLDSVRHRFDEADRESV
jgi:hypothetical protein